jgi:dual specificity phosphatase 3
MTTTFTSQPTRPTDPKHWWRTVCWVDDRLAVSGDLPANRDRALAQLRYWESEGITDVFDVRIEGNDSEFIRANSSITPHWVGIDDDGTRRPDSWFEQLTARAGEVLADPNRRLLAHCHLGANRGPSALFTIMISQGWEPVDALRAIRTARPIAGIIYAPDAVAWWCRNSGMTATEAVQQVADVKAWFSRNRLDLGWVIARLRD